MACKVLFSSPSPFNACSAPASVGKVVEVVVVDLLLSGLARVWETTSRLALFFQIWIFMLASLRRSCCCRDLLVGEEICQIILFSLVAKYLLLLRSASQTFLDARATHYALSSRAYVFSVLGSYEAADAAA